MKAAVFADLVGQTLTHIEKHEDEAIVFVTDGGKSFRMYHEQDCCESVSIESIVGDLADLLGTPILKAEEATSDQAPEGARPRDLYGDTSTWTFYKLATIKGYVDIRWFGCSNGYYSESVNFALLEDGK